MKATLYSLSGKATSEVTLPKSLFEVVVKPVTLAQVIRVLSSRQHNGAARAQTRAEVNRTTAKVYAQKHTGRARHGARSAPIYVGGGVAHGPKGLLPAALKITRKVKRLSVLGVLNLHAAKNTVALLTGLDKAKPKTRELSSLIKQISPKGKVLVLTATAYPEFAFASQNLQKLSNMPAKAANALSLLKAKYLIIDQAALPLMEDWLVSKKTKAVAEVVVAKVKKTPAAKATKAVKTTTKKTK